MNYSKKWTKFVVGFDPHGVNQDDKVNNAFFKFVSHWKAELRICGGDCFDFKQLRRKADQHDKRDSMAADVAAGKQWLTQFAPHVWTRGNHDERLWDTASREDGIVADYAKEGIADLEKLTKKLGCLTLPWDTEKNFYRLGNSEVYVTHGFHHGKTAVRRAISEFGHSLIQGHGHQIQYISESGIKKRFAMMGGCLCRKDMEYAKSFPAKTAWRSGWVYGVISGSSVHVWQAQQTDCGKWLLPTGVEEL